MFLNAAIDLRLFFELESALITTGELCLVALNESNQTLSIYRRSHYGTASPQALMFLEIMPGPFAFVKYMLI